VKVAERRADDLSSAKVTSGPVAMGQKREPVLDWIGAPGTTRANLNRQNEAQSP